MKFHHVGIFVSDIKIGREYLVKLLPFKKFSKIYNDKNLGVSVQFLEDDNKIVFEIVAPFSKPNPTENVLKSGKNILNHVAYMTKDFDNICKAFRNEGAIPLCEPKKALAFNNNRIMFFLTNLKFIIEIIEDK